jgi:hypothetical protein
MGQPLGACKPVKAVWSMGQPDLTAAALEEFMVHLVVA